MESKYSCVVLLGDGSIVIEKAEKAEKNFSSDEAKDWLYADVKGDVGIIKWFENGPIKFVITFQATQNELESKIIDTINFFAQFFSDECRGEMLKLMMKKLTIKNS